MGNLSKKFTVLQWFVQYFLGFLLGALAGMAAIFYGLVDIKQMESIKCGMEFKKLYTITLVGLILGIVLGDLSLYKGQKLSILAVILAFFVGLVGYTICCLENSIVLWIIDKVPPPFLIVIISLITYNAISQLRRKRFAERKLRDEN